MASSMSGTLGAAEHRNTAEIIDKYCNNANPNVPLLNVNTKCLKLRRILVVAIKLKKNITYA